MPRSLADHTHHRAASDRPRMAAYTLSVNDKQRGRLRWNDIEIEKSPEADSLRFDHRGRCCAVGPQLSLVRRNSSATTYEQGREAIEKATYEHTDCWAHVDVYRRRGREKVNKSVVSCSTRARCPDKLTDDSSVLTSRQACG